jgi:hypothetical protein
MIPEELQIFNAAPYFTIFTQQYWLWYKFELQKFMDHEALWEKYFKLHTNHGLQNVAQFNDFRK